MYLLMFVVQQFSSRETTRASCLIVMSQYKQTIQSDKIFFQRIATELTSIKCRFSVSVLNLEIDSFRYQLVSPIDSQQLSQSEGRICNSPRSWFVLIPDSRRRFEELQPICRPDVHYPQPTHRWSEILVYKSLAWIWSSGTERLHTGQTFACDSAK